MRLKNKTEQKRTAVLLLVAFKRTEIEDKDAFHLDGGASCEYLNCLNKLKVQLRVTVKALSVVALQTTI